jgi:hypothetical protein
MDEQPIEVATDHPCILAVLTRRLSASRDGDLTSLAAQALEAMLKDDRFDSCCAPRYLALAPERSEREIQIPIAKEGGIATRVLVWPVGSKDMAHPHVDGWTVFVPVIGELTSVSRTGDSPVVVAPLEPRRPKVLRPEAGVVHLVRNQAGEPGMTIHVSGPS